MHLYNALWLQQHSLQLTSLRSIVVSRDTMGSNISNPLLANRQLYMYK